MGRYMGKCKGVVGEITEVDVAEISACACDGRLTRSRTLATAAVEETSSRSPEKIKRMRTVGDGELSFDSATCVDLRSTRCRILIAPATTSKGSESAAICGVVSSVETNCSDQPPVSCFSSKLSCELIEDRLGAADPSGERRSAEVGTLKFSDAKSVRSRKVESITREESGDLENSAPRRSSEADSALELTVEKMPSKSEIDQFLTAAEKDLHKRFIDKYNFDVVNDVPLGGRYEWVPVKP